MNECSRPFFALRYIPVFHAGKLARLLLALVLTAALSGCGLAYNNAVHAMKYKSPIPSQPHEAVIAAAREHPKDALISYSFYREATPDEVREILAAHPSKPGRQLRMDTNNSGYATGTPLAAVEGLLLPVLTPNSEWRYPLDEAMRASPYPEVVGLLLDAGATSPDWAINYSPEKFDVEILDKLLTKSPPKENYAKWLLETLIVHNAADQVDIFLKKGPRLDLNKPDESGRTYLALSASEKTPETARLLIEAGALVDPMALGHALLNENPKMLETLLSPEQGAAEAAGQASGLLAYLAIWPEKTYRTENIDVLLQLGADPNFRTSDGRTTLMHAAQTNNPEMTLRLLKAGADPNLTDKNGKKALDYAKKNNAVETVQILQRKSTAGQ